MAARNDWTREYATLVKEPFRWKAKDGMEIEGLLVEPKLIRDAMRRNLDWFARWMPMEEAR